MTTCMELKAYRALGTKRCIQCKATRSTDNFDKKLYKVGHVQIASICSKCRWKRMANHKRKYQAPTLLPANTRRCGHCTLHKPLTAFTKGTHMIVQFVCDACLSECTVCHRHVPPAELMPATLTDGVVKCQFCHFIEPGELI